MKVEKNDLLVQGSILAIAGLLTKIIGFVYRIPMMNLLGTVGNGIYSVACNIYNIALTLSSYGLPLAVSKLVSERVAKKEYKNSFQIFRNSLIIAVIAGGITCALLFFGADILEVAYKKEGLARPLRVLAPTTLIVAILGVFRGFFQGKNTMVPTAISQVLEQIVNAIISIVAAYTFMKLHKTSTEIFSYGAAGGTIGTLAGALFALLFLLYVYLINRPTIMSQGLLDKSIIESSQKINKIIIFTMIPVILSQTVYQIGNTLDDLIFSNLMNFKGYDSEYISSLQGVFNTQYNVLINLPVSIATAMAASAIPSIIQSITNNKKEEFHAKVSSLLKVNIVIALPSAVGLAVLAKPIITMLFPKIVEYRDIASNLLITGSSALIFYAIATLTSAIIQGVNNMKIPVIHSGISLVLHIILVMLLLWFTDLGVNALIIGNITFPLVISILNCIFLYKNIGYRFELRTSFFIPLLSSTIMGVIAYGCSKLINSLLYSNALSCLLTIAISIVAYSMLIIKFHCFSEEELLELPFGGKIVAAIHRFHVE